MAFSTPCAVHSSRRETCSLPKCQHTITNYTISRCSIFHICVVRVTINAWCVHRRRLTKRDDDGELVFGFKSSECHNYVALQLEHATTWKTIKRFILMQPRLLCLFLTKDFCSVLLVLIHIKLRAFLWRCSRFVFTMMWRNNFPNCFPTAVRIGLHHFILISIASISIVQLFMCLLYCRAWPGRFSSKYKSRSRQKCISFIETE